MRINGAHIQLPHANIFTVISIPTILLWPTRIPRRNRLPIAALAILSLALILTPIFRLAFSPLSNGVVDDPWMWLWEFVEPAVGIALVSLVPFRSLFLAPNKSLNLHGATSHQGKPRTWPGPLRKLHPAYLSSHTRTVGDSRMHGSSNNLASAPSPQSPRTGRRLALRDKEWQSHGSLGLESALSAHTAAAPTCRLHSGTSSVLLPYWRLSLGSLPGHALRGLGLTQPGSPASSRGRSIASKGSGNGCASMSIASWANTEWVESPVPWSVSESITPPSPLSWRSGGNQERDVEKRLPALPKAADIGRRQRPITATKAHACPRRESSRGFVRVGSPALRPDVPYRSPQSTQR